MCVQQYWHNASKPYRFMPVAEMAEHFKNFSVGRQIAANLATPPPVTPLGGTHRGNPEASTASHSPSSLPVLFLCGTMMAWA